MVYSCICFSLQLPGENTWVKQDQWNEGRRKRDFEDLVLKCSCVLDGFYWILAVCCQWCTPDETSSCRCCLCASDCWVGWKQVKERTDVLLSGVGFCAKGFNQGNSCLWQRIYSQLLVFLQANSNKQGCLRYKNALTKMPSLSFQRKAKVKSCRLKTMQYFLKYTQSCCLTYFCLSTSLLGIILLRDLVIFVVKGR